LTSVRHVRGSAEFKGIVAARRGIGRDVPAVGARGRLYILSNGGDRLQGGAGALGKHNLRNTVDSRVDPGNRSLFTSLVGSTL
jgi:hypothetical protein